MLQSAPIEEFLSPVSPPAIPLPRTRSATITGLGTALPAAIVSNAPIAARIGVTDEWIVKRTGIRSRHVAGPDECLVDLAAAAGEEALDQAGVAADELDLVLVATCSADQLLPHAAPLVADALGAVRAGAFDVGAACTGFLSGLALSAALIESGRAGHVLLVGAELMSRIVDPDCRGTAALFGDGAGAAVIGSVAGRGPGNGNSNGCVAGDRDGGGRIGAVALGADGSGGELIKLDRGEAWVQMDGQETFKNAVARMCQATREALELAELTLADIDLFVYHQANSRILRAVGEQLGLPAERVIDCIANYANTSAATLPLALAHARREGRLHPGDRVLLGAFGAGFNWGATVVEWGLAGP